ncbi:MAG: hypothetical protein Q8P67_05495 [archaeon]|nr:hypothetical protein [archaeon]
MAAAGGPLGLDADKIMEKVTRGAEERYKGLKDADREAVQAAEILECFLGESQRLLLKKLRVPEVMICPGEFDCSLCHPESNSCACTIKSKTTLVDIGQFHLSPACFSPQAPHPLIPYVNPSLSSGNDPPASLGFVSLCGCPVHVAACYMCDACRKKSDWSDEKKGTIRVRHRAIPRKS